MLILSNTFDLNIEDDSQNFDEFYVQKYTHTLKHKGLTFYTIALNKKSFDLLFFKLVRIIASSLFINSIKLMLRSTMKTDIKNAH